MNRVRSQSHPRLTPSELQILGAIQFDATLSLTETAKKHGFSERTLRHSLARLTELQIVRKAAFLNPYALGYGYSLIYFSISRGGAKVRENLIEALRKSKRVSWLAELGGEFQYIAAILIRRPSETREFLYNFTKKFQNLIHEKSILYQSSLGIFPRKYLQDSITPRLGELYCDCAASEIEYDELDEEILRELSVDGGLSVREMGRRLNRSHTTIENRIARLRTSGAILGWYYRIDARRLGFQSFKLLIYAKGISQVVRDSIRKFCFSHRQALSFIECIGEWDFEIGVDAISQQDVVPVVHELYDSFGDMLSSIKVIPVLRVFKFEQLPALKAASRAQIEGY